MKVLVTGVKGQLGFDVVNELNKRGHVAVENGYNRLEKCFYNPHSLGIW